MDNFFAMLSISLELLTIICSILVFFKGRLRYAGVRSFGVLCLLFIVMTSSYYLFRPVFGSGTSFKTIYSVYSLVLITAALAWLFNERFFITAFIVFAARNYMDGVNLISEFVSALYRIAAIGQKGMAIRFFCRMFVYLAFIPLLYQIFKRYIYPAIESTKHLDIWKYLWMVPASFYLIFRLGIYPFLESPSAVWTIPDYFFSFVWLLGMYFCQIALFKLLSESSQNLLLTEKLRTAELLTEMEKKQYELLQNNMEESRKAKHDFRHHMLALRGYAELGDDQGCLRYIDQYLSQSDSYQMQGSCNNHAVDSIISYYAQNARTHDITIDISVQLPPILPIPEIDFCTILGNLLSNAVEAAIRQTEGKRFIRLNMGMAGSSMIAVSVINSYSGEIREKDGVFLSSHHPDEGIGTMSIRHLASKYHGVVKFQYEDGIFEASLLLNSGLLT